MAKIQMIKSDAGRPAYAVLPWADYVRLAIAAGADPEDLALIAMAEAARDEDTFPADVAKRLAAGENVLKTLREWRGLTQEELGAKADMSKQYISQIETGRREIGMKVAKKLAPALGIGVESLVM